MTDSKSILNRYWGYDAFRDPQEQIIRSVLEKKDTIALLPTGGGKSICFQIPALMLPGKTIVVSPLIALMQDQVDNLFRRNIIARTLNANLHYKEIDAILDNFVYGEMKILYISPERIGSQLFMTRIANANISLIAVDESHCISQWGYDFRPSYFNIPKLRELHPEATMIALTATATPVVLEDIAQRLELKTPSIFKKSFIRDNLGLTVIYGEDKKNELLNTIRKIKGSSIIYVRNRRETLEIATWLQHHSISCVSYHGGMSKDIRDKNQQAWMNNAVRIIVCTNAFGMGIDKPDVRLVVHMDVPPSLEEYYQEVGRAGRDGFQSQAIALIEDADTDAAKSNLNDQFPSLELIAATYDRLCRYLNVAYGSGNMETYDFELPDFALHTGIPSRKLFHIINILDKEGWLTTSEAFKEPSKLKIVATIEDLEYINRNPSLHSKIIVHLLRKYEGLFLDYVKIDDTRIATELHMEESQLVSGLRQMQSEGMIQYIPRNTKPQITLTKPRPEISHFTIDRLSYLQRKKMAENRLKSMIQYFVHENTCRQKTIITYFGENTQNCGKCDFCLGAFTVHASDDETQKVTNHLFKTLTVRNIKAKTYIAMYPFHYRKRVFGILQKLESEHRINLDTFGTMTLAT